MKGERVMSNFSSQDFLIEHNEFMKHNGVSVVAVTSDTAKTTLTVAPQSLNPYGIVHGGALFTLMDVAAGVAARADGRRYVTLDSSVHFLKSVGRGLLYGTASVVHRGRSVCVVDTEVTAQEGVLLCRGSFTMFCLNDTADVPSQGWSSRWGLSLPSPIITNLFISYLFNFLLLLNM